MTFPRLLINAKLVSARERSIIVEYISRYDFTKDMPKTPAPNTYDQHGDIEVNKQKNKGF